MAGYTTITVTNDALVRTITFNRPKRRNAMTPEMQMELILAMEEAAASDCRVLVLSGAGEAFCSGLDLSTLQEMKDNTGAGHRVDVERLARLLLTLYELPMPTIAAVHGAAIGGGMGLATISDFTLATPAARFGYPEVKIGFVPALVSAFLALQIGDKRSRDLLLTGRLFDGAEAQRLGLATEVVAPEQLAQRVRSLAETLLVNSPVALAATKKLLAAQNRVWLDAAIAQAMRANEKARETPDFREGVSAFLEKRKPVWAK